MLAANCCSQRIKPLRGPRRVLWVVVVTTWAWGMGDGWAWPATRPAKWAMSIMRKAPTLSAMARMRGKSNWRG